MSAKGAALGLALIAAAILRPGNDAFGADTFTF
jgi:hypothetical protein